MKIPHLLCASCLVVVTATSAHALTPKGRHLIGTIQKVDAQTREVAMKREDNTKVVQFVWNKQTTFVAGTRTADASMLKNGARVEVTYHAPFFGSPFVTKVLLLPPSSAASTNK